MFDRGLVLRYLSIKDAYLEFEHDVEPFITDFVRQVLEKERPFEYTVEEQLFRDTFQRIADAMGEDSWRHCRNGRHSGPLSVYVFETVSTGIAANIDRIRHISPGDLRDRIVEFKQRSEFVNNTGAGANIKSKLLNRVSFARSFFGE
jgi:hypothetical protein